MSHMTTLSRSGTPTQDELEDRLPSALRNVSLSSNPSSLPSPFRSSAPEESIDFDPIPLTMTSADPPGGDFKCFACRKWVRSTLKADSHCGSDEHRTNVLHLFRYEGFEANVHEELWKFLMAECERQERHLAPRLEIPSAPYGYTRIYFVAMRNRVAQITVEVWAPDSFSTIPDEGLIGLTVPPALKLPIHWQFSTGKVYAAEDDDIQPVQLLVRTRVTFRESSPAELMQRRESEVLRKIRKSKRFKAKGGTPEEKVAEILRETPTISVSLRVQTVQVSDPDVHDLTVLEEDLNKMVHRQDTFVTLESPFIGQEACLIEVQTICREANYVGGHVHFYPFYHVSTLPVLEELRELCANAPLELESVGFYPSISGLCPEEESIGVPDSNKLRKNYKNYRSAIPLKLRQMYHWYHNRLQSEEIRIQEAGRFLQSKAPYQYIANYGQHQRIPGDYLAKSIIDAGIHEIFKNRKFAPETTAPMLLRDLLIAIYGNDLINHVELRNFELLFPVENVRPNQTDAEKLEMEETNTEDLNVTPADMVVQLRVEGSQVRAAALKIPGTRLGFFEESLANLQASKSGPRYHLEGSVESCEEQDGWLIVSVRVSPVIKDKSIRLVTILPDHRVLAAALTVMEFFDYEPEGDSTIGVRPDGPPPKYTKLQRRIESLGGDPEVVGDSVSEASDQEVSRTRQMKESLREKHRAWMDRLWTPVPPVNAVSSLVPHGLYHDLADNAKQAQLVEQVCREERYFDVLWGPPGTGKTTAIAIAALGRCLEVQRRGESKKILMVAPTNRAADAIALALLDRIQGNEGDFCPSICRIYAGSYEQDFIDPKLIPLAVTFEGLAERNEDGSGPNPLESIQQSNIIVTTLDMAIYRLLLLYNQCSFSMVVIDEAGRVPTALAFPLFCLGDTVLLSGDHQQMRPYFPHQLRFLSDFHQDVSVQQFLIDIGHPYIQLVKNFRSVRPIVTPSNIILYKEECMEPALHDTHSATFRSLLARYEDLRDYFPRPGISIAHVSGVSEHLPRGSSWSNFAEVFYIGEFVAMVDRTGLGAEARVGVVCFYAAQITAIFEYLKLLRRRGVLSRRQPWLRVMSADKFQGSDAEIILISCCRGCMDSTYGLKNKKDIGFVGQPQRGSVAVTRAKLGVLVFCRLSEFLKNPFWHEVFVEADDTGSFPSVTVSRPTLHRQLAHQADRKKVSLTLPPLRFVRDPPHDGRDHRQQWREPRRSQGLYKMGMPLYIVETENEIGFFGREAFPFSNHSVSSFQLDLDGIDAEFLTAEQAYYYFKFLFSGNVNAATYVRALVVDPAEIKRIGRKALPPPSVLIQWYSTKAIPVMRHILQAKFSQGVCARDALLATAPKKLVECNPHDMFWGAGISLQTFAQNPGSSFNGKNILGKLLMEVRTLLLRLS